MAVADLSKLLRSSSINRILITGASGWIGRETIALLQPILGDDFSRRVTLAGSRDAIIAVNERTHHVKKLRDIGSDQRFDLVIHLAFLTQDKAKELGEVEFAHLNRELTAFVYDLCQSAKAKYVLVASSGAANPQVWQRYENPSKKLYGQLKQESEELFMQLQKENKALVDVCRIWSISGAQIQSPQKYALGDFIIQAKSTGNIELGTAGVVKRAYVDAGELVSVLLLNLLTGGNGILDSGGFETTLQNLARLVLDEFNPRGGVFLPKNSTLDGKDIYVPDLVPFNILAEKLDVRLSSLDEQIRRTAKAQFFH